MLAGCGTQACWHQVRCNGSEEIALGYKTHTPHTDPPVQDRTMHRLLIFLMYCMIEAYAHITPM